MKLVYRLPKRSTTLETRILTGSHLNLGANDQVEAISPAPRRFKVSLITLHKSTEFPSS